MSRTLSVALSTLSAVVAALRQQSLAARPPPGLAAPDGAAARAAGAGGWMAGPAAGHVPWRDSPLTRWLQQPLAAAGHLLVVAAVSPAPQAAPDTLSTLSYASKLRSGLLALGGGGMAAQAGRAGAGGGEVTFTASWQQPAVTAAAARGQGALRGAGVAARCERGRPLS